MQEGLKEDQMDVQSRRKLSERGNRYTRGEHILIERDQETINVINIHSRDKGQLSKQEVKCVWESERAYQKGNVHDTAGN